MMTSLSKEIKPFADLKRTKLHKMEKGKRIRRIKEWNRNEIINFHTLAAIKHVYPHFRWSEMIKNYLPSRSACQVLTRENNYREIIQEINSLFWEDKKNFRLAKFDDLFRYVRGNIEPCLKSFVNSKSKSSLSKMNNYLFTYKKTELHQKDEDEDEDKLNSVNIEIEENLFHRLEKLKGYENSETISLDYEFLSNYLLEQFENK